jgi:hypothetical protein
MGLSGWQLGALLGAVLLFSAGGVALAMRSGDDAPTAVLITPLSGPDGNPAAGRGAARGSGRMTPVPTPTPPPPPRSVFDTRQIVTYYGNPYSETMGILGEYQGDELVRRVKAQAAKYQALNTDKQVVAALHLVYAVAQGSPGPDGSYITHMPDEMVDGLIELTRANDMLFFIDLQNGLLDPVEEARKVQHWLKNDHVHLAVDPEFTLQPGENPHDDIGSIDGEVVNRIQDILQQTALENGITNKILIVHQFRPDMITNKQLIAKDRDRVDVVLNMDGWGGPEAKLSKYEAHVTNEPVEYAGIKLFYRWDKPMLTEAQIEALTPRPNYIQYQ